MRRTLIVAVGLVLAIGLVGAGWWVRENRIWLRDDYKTGFEVGTEYDRQTRLEACGREVQDRFAVAVSVSMPEDSAAFTIGCYDGSRDRFRPAAIGSMLSEFMGG